MTLPQAVERRNTLRALWPVWKTYVAFEEHAAKGERPVSKNRDAGRGTIVTDGRSRTADLSDPVLIRFDSSARVRGSS